MLQSWELTKPIKVSHGRFVNYDVLRTFFKGFASGEDKYRLFFWTLLETGARVREACAIQENDYFDNYRKIKMVTCKDPKVRVVTLSPFLAAFTKRWCDYNRQRFQYGYVFPVPGKHARLQPHHCRLFLSKKRKQLKMDVPVRIVKTKKIVGFGKQREIRYYALGNHSFRRFYETHMTDLSNGNYMLIASIMQYSDPTIVRDYYDDFRAVKAEEVLAEKYHDTIVAGMLHDRPILPRNQKTLKNFSGEEEPKELWGEIEQKYKKKVPR